MGDFSDSKTVNKTATYAKSSNYTEVNNTHIECPECHSENTICIYEDASGCIIGWNIDREYYCRSCNNYIVYIQEYES